MCGIAAALRLSVRQGHRQTVDPTNRCSLRDEGQAVHSDPDSFFAIGLQIYRPCPALLVRYAPRLARGLDSVTGNAQRLPVPLIPEQRSVAAMRDHVIQDAGGRSVAVHADGMTDQEADAQPTEAPMVDTVKNM